MSQPFVVTRRTQPATNDQVQVIIDFEGRICPQVYFHGSGLLSTHGRGEMRVHLGVVGACHQMGDDRRQAERGV